MSYPDLPNNRLIVGGVDLTEEFKMVLADGYTLSPPSPKTYEVDIPGGNGKLDLTESMLGDCAYENRTQEFTFYVIAPYNFETVKTKVSAYLHGRTYDYVMTMDPNYTYRGRFSVTGYDHLMYGIGVVGTIKISVDADPFKYKQTQIRKINAVGGIIMNLKSGRKRVCPVIETGGYTKIIYDGKVYTLNQGSWRINDILLTAGDNEVYFNTYNVRILTWKNLKDNNITWGEFRTKRIFEWYKSNGTANAVLKTWADVANKTWSEVMGSMSWTRSNITSGYFYSVYYAGGKWVAAGNGLYYSTDGMTWTQSNITSGTFKNVYYANGIWVAAGIGNNGLYYSTNGQSWTRSNITSGYFYSVYYAGGKWVAAGVGLYYSTNGQSWTQSNITSESFHSIYYANGIWAAAGSYDNGLYYSTDGMTWTQSNVTSGAFESVYYANGIWVAAGSDYNGLYYSTNGQSWTQSNITGEVFNSVYYAGGKWIAAGVGLYYSTNGQSWTQSNITDGYFGSVYYANGIWIAADIGNNGLYYSTDGMTWTQSNITDGYFGSVYYANGIWAAAGSYDNGLYYSIRFATWEDQMYKPDDTQYIQDVYVKYDWGDL